ncbi:MAG: AMP-binding protein [Candidatus Eremiobacteraeota bacterium]|nr:AMP-binding protein [Candidatus Eremiobacteraeota bacterium]
MIIERLEQVRRRRAGHSAVVSKAETLSYDQLLARAARCSRNLRRPVVVAQGRSPDTIVTWLAAWMSGRPFATLDPCWPKARQRELLALLEPAPTEELAYLVFTSGSTGAPKAVKLTHRGLLPMLDHQREVFGLSPHSRSLWLLSPGFDASLSDVFTTLLAGATLVIDETPCLITRLERHAITHLDLPPALLSTFERLPNRVKTLIVGGEICPAATIRRFAAQHRVVNVYGPSEATICTSMSVCTTDWERPMLGPPLPGVEYRVIGEELYIAGLQLAVGYHGAPELTRQKFPLLDGKRYFRTGDRVVERDGDFEFLGRTDRQVKIRGCLVALEEVEACLRSVPGAGRAAAGLRDGQLVAQIDGCPESARRYLVASLAGIDGCPESARRYLLERLPAFMIPTRFEAYQATGDKSRFVAWPDSLEVLRRCAQAQEQGENLVPTDFYQASPPATPRLTSRRLELGPAGRLLLTGSTGFLGSRLSEHLECRHLAAPTRAALDLESPMPRYEVDTIVHCAATTDLTLSRQQHDRLNLEGTRRLLELPARFHHISTLAVMVGGSACGRIDEDTPPLEHLHGAYAQSKRAAELLVQSRGPAWIYRPGLLVGPPTRRPSQLFSFLRGLVRWKCLPAGDHEGLRLDLTPVDYAARSIARLVSVAPPGIYHLANSRSMSLAQLSDFATSKGHPIEVLEPEDWLATVQGDDLFRLSLPALLGNPDRSLDLFLASQVHFDCSRTEAWTGLACPPPEQILESIWPYV